MRVRLYVHVAITLIACVQAHKNGPNLDRKTLQTHFASSSSDHVMTMVAIDDKRRHSHSSGFGYVFCVLSISWPIARCSNAGPFAGQLSCFLRRIGSAFCIVAIVNLFDANENGNGLCHENEVSACADKFMF